MICLLIGSDGGFCRAVSDSYDLAKLTESLGEHFFCNDLILKPYSCCGTTHSSIDCARELVMRYRITPDQIAKVIVYNASPIKMQNDWDYVPVGTIQAQMNIRYCVAAAIVEGEVFVKQFTEEKISDPRLVKMAGQVEFRIDPEIEAIYPARLPGKVEIITKDGKSYLHAVDGPKGSPQDPLTWEEAQRKCRTLLNEVLDTGVAEKIIDVVTRIEEVDDIRELTTLLG